MKKAKNGKKLVVSLYEEIKKRSGYTREWNVKFVLF